MFKIDQWHICSVDNSMEIYDKQPCSAVLYRLYQLPSIITTCVFVVVFCLFVFLIFIYFFAITKSAMHNAAYTILVYTTRKLHTKNAILIVVILKIIKQVKVWIHKILDLQHYVKHI